MYRVLKIRNPRQVGQSPLLCHLELRNRVGPGASEGGGDYRMIGEEMRGGPMSALLYRFNLPMATALPEPAPPLCNTLGS